MPRGDGTGPTGSGTGAGNVRVEDQNFGPGGSCVCPKCGKTGVHQRGTSCTKISCPSCGSLMIRA